MSDVFNEDSVEQKPAKICVVKSAGKYSYQDIYSESELENTDMTRISEFETVTFRPRSKEEIVPEMVAKIDKEIQEARIGHEQQIRRLLDRRQDLLSLGYEQPDNLDEFRPAAEAESVSPIPQPLIDDDIPF